MSITKTFNKQTNATVLKSDLDLDGFDTISVESNDGVTSIILEDEPSGTELSSLQDNIDSNSALWESVENSNDHFKIYEFVSNPGAANPVGAPFDLNFKTGLKRRLHPKHTRTQGELRKVEYFENATLQQDGSVIYSDPVLTEEFVYVRDLAGFALSRTQTISWYLRDGSLSPKTKVLNKVYELNDRLREGIRRRGNIITTLEATLAGILIQTQTHLPLQERLDVGRVFIATYKTSLDLFKETSDQQIHVDIQAATDAWLDIDLGGGVTPRAIMLAEINIWGL